MNSLFGVKSGQKLGEDFQFSNGSYSSFNTFDINFLGLPVYRADTKEEFLIDAATLLGIVVTNGFYAGFRFIVSEVERD